MADVAVALDCAYDRDGRSVVLVKLSTAAWEFNFRATSGELAGLGSIRDADWLARRCLHIGESAGAPVHWAHWAAQGAEGETVTIMVGHDPETWDISLTVPVAAVDTIVTDLAEGSWRLGIFEPG